jgi:hypothetical protein
MMKYSPKKGFLKRIAYLSVGVKVSAGLADYLEGLSLTYKRKDLSGGHAPEAPSALVHHQSTS